MRGLDVLHLSARQNEQGRGARVGDQGRCQSGHQICDGYMWTECIDVVRPAVETCNGDDDDCDGLIDEGLPPYAVDRAPASIVFLGV